MTRSGASLAAAVVTLSLASKEGNSFAFLPVTSRPPSTTQNTQCTTTALRMGLFDGLKDAFSAPAMERSNLDAERETPIDRWMGWNVKKESSSEERKAVNNFVDAMDANNYAIASLAKPMGIVFEENGDGGGIFILSISESGAAAQDGTLKPADQLVAVGDKKVSGLPFDEALGAIVDSEAEKTKLIFFRGPSNDFYGPTGASQAWLDEFISVQTSKKETTKSSAN